MLEGEPGIGKTTLWLAGIGQARQRGFRVLLCRPSAAEAQLSYASLADLLADVDDDCAGVLAGTRNGGRSTSSCSGAEAEHAVTDYRATGAALLSVLERLADDMPVLLAIDDLQWMDSSSAQVVDFALRRLSSRVGVLGALRSPGASDRSCPLLRSDPDRVHRIRVGPLTLGALHQMLRDLDRPVVPPATLTRIEQISGGNPFYALELARVYTREGTADPSSPLPQTLAQLIRTRIDGIRPEVQPALLAAAALGEPTVELVQLALDTGPGDGRAPARGGRGATA